MALNKAPYKGTQDFFPAQMRLRNYVFDKMSEISEHFAYEPYDGPLLEEVELYMAKSGEELINDQIYSFIDRGDRKVAIRPEMTPTVARMAAQVHREVTKPFRWYAIPNLMRYEKPQKGRLREFWQYNADIFGAPEGLGEIEILQLAVGIMKGLGATHEHFEILLNDRRLVDNIFQKLFCLSPEEAKKLYKVADKVKKIDEAAIKKMTALIITDDKKAELFYQYLKLDNFTDLKMFLQQNDLMADSQDFLTFVNRLEKFALTTYVKFDPSIVRGLDYYTGVVFEIFDKHPENRRAIAGGGAYANLLQIFNEPALPGVGFGLGLVTLTDFLTTHKLLPDLVKASVDVLMAYISPAAEQECFMLAQKIRSFGISTELMFGETKPKKAFTQAEKKHYRFIVLMGDEEMNKNEVQIKNLETREQQNVSIQDMEKITRIFKGN